MRLIVVFLLLAVTAFASDAGDRLAQAIEKGDLKAVQVLVESGVNPDSVIQYHSQSGSQERIKGVDAGIHKMTPLMKACWDGRLEIAQYLLKKGANVNAVDDELKTPLFFAIQRASLEIVELLIARGAKTNVQDLRRLTPIHSAVAAPNPKIVKALAQAGADLDAEAEGLTALMFAASSGNVEMIQLLVKLGADVNHPSQRDGSTALFSAIKSGTPDAVQAFIDLKANVNAKTIAGDTPLAAAQKRNHPKILALLKAAGAR